MQGHMMRNSQHNKRVLVTASLLWHDADSSSEIGEGVARMQAEDGTAETE